MANTFGPPVFIDGPPPSPPALTLVGASRNAPTTGDRWINGAALWPYPRDMPDVFDPCQAASSAGHSKDAGTPTAEETFAAFNVLEGITCTTRSVRDPAEWQRRVQVALEAYEHYAIEREFWTGALRPDNPHLAQDLNNGQQTVYPNGFTITSIENAVALLEQAIADEGGNGVIHMRPAVFSQLSKQSGGAISVDRGIARTQLGTIIVPGVGYTGSSTFGSPPSGTEEWIIATGPIDIRRSEPEIVPSSMGEATDRRQNLTTFRAERYVLVTWDQRIHAAVGLDREFTTFTS